jgi:outer membrane protein OmpA-like peptidoglycan-associated protein
MSTNIYELCGKGLRGAPVMCHLVATGAHDGRPATGSYQVRKVRRNHFKQYKSWFSQASDVSLHDAHPVVGQIYFPFEDKSLDGLSDRIALDALIAWCHFQLGQDNRIELQFIGHADPRGAASYNTTLGLRRAKAVQTYVDKGLRANLVERVRFFRYKSKADSLGETMATGDRAADRRVDIVLSSVDVKSFVLDPDPLFVTGEYKGPLTKKLLFRPRGGGGFGVGPIGFDELEIEIKNPNTGATAFYLYGGGNVGVGFPVSKSLPSKDYQEKVVPCGFVDVDDFEGRGSIDSAMAVGGEQCLTFAGPKLHYCKMFKKEGVAFCFTGWDLQVGASKGEGYWSLMPYRTEKDREAYLEGQANRRRELERPGFRPTP